MLNYQNTDLLPSTNTHQQVKLSYWIDIHHATNNIPFYQLFGQICQQHQQDKRWVMIMDAKKEDIELLKVSEKIGDTKVLKVNSQQLNISLENIHKLLSAGNCAALILCNTQFSHQQLLKLSQFAQQGKTHCIVINNLT